MLYLNETTRMEPTQIQAHIEDFAGTLAPILAELGIALVGLWQTYRSNELVEVWEVADWQSLDRLQEAAQKDERLAGYYARANLRRQAWNTKILRPTAFCPDLARIRRHALKGGVYLMATIPIVPERLAEYLELFPRNGMRLEEKHGLHTVGYWTGGGADQSEAFNCTQLCVIENWAEWGRFSAARAADPETSEWLRRALFYRTYHRSRFLTPAYLPY